MTIGELLNELSGQPLERKVRILYELPDSGEEIVTEVLFTLADDEISGEKSFTIICGDAI